jgi:hypothetical protein
MFRSRLAAILLAAPFAPPWGSPSAFGQAPAPADAGRPSHRLHLHRPRQPACATCVAEKAATRTTSSNYASKDEVVCYVEERCGCFKCLLRFHGHHRDCGPTVVPVVKRVLVKTRVTEEKPETRYKGSLAPRPESPGGPPPCALHGLGCEGGH